MKQKIFTLFFALMASVGMYAEIYSGTCGDDLNWNLDTETGVLNITGSGDMCNYKDKRVPWRDYQYLVKKVVMFDGITSIGSYAFSNCSTFTSVTIPISVKKIGSWAFYYCSGLTSIRCEAITPPDVPYEGGSVFSGVAMSIPLYVPTNSINDYKEADLWKEFKNILPITYESIDNIETSANYDQSRKLLRNGQIFILRGDKTYTMTGQETIVP